MVCKVIEDANSTFVKAKYKMPGKKPNKDVPEKVVYFRPGLQREFWARGINVNAFSTKVEAGVMDKDSIQRQIGCHNLCLCSLQQEPQTSVPYLF